MLRILRDHQRRDMFLVSEEASLDYSISELEEITGAPKRALIHWAESGIIKPDPSTDRAGSGKHRRFARDEALIACIIHVLTAQKSTVGYLLRTSTTIRMTLDDNVFGTDHTSWRFHYERAIANQGKNLMLVILDGDSPPAWFCSPTTRVLRRISAGRFSWRWRTSRWRASCP